MGSISCSMRPSEINAGGTAAARLVAILKLRGIETRVEGSLQHRHSRTFNLGDIFMNETELSNIKHNIQSIIERGKLSPLKAQSGCDWMHKGDNCSLSFEHYAIKGRGDAGGQLARGTHGKEPVHTDMRGGRGNGGTRDFRRRKITTDRDNKTERAEL
ncbi:hypothetical protein J6590_035404 [Homalodisca vitripennis]|nr:hypothetical protein J6590_035404 [Homalodisca vitripennis]